MVKQYFVYILTNQKNGTLYIGVTNNILRRLQEHRESQVDGFSKQYGLKKLVYIEATDSIEAALLREKQLKKWNRAWKVRLIEESNPDWKDISHLT